VARKATKCPGIPAAAASELQNVGPPVMPPKFPLCDALEMKTMFFVVVVTLTVMAPLMATAQLVPVHPFDQAMMAPAACVTVNVTLDPRGYEAVVEHVVPEHVMPEGLDAIDAVCPPSPWKLTVKTSGMALHVPPLHCCTLVHTWLQDPQLLGSLPVAVQTPAQDTYPLAQTHIPAAQVMFVPHEVASGAVGFEHTPVPAAHVPATWHESSAVQDDVPQHTPFTQYVPVAQVVVPTVHACPGGAVAWHVLEPALQ
jgi:hypothetical protein